LAGFSRDKPGVIVDETLQLLPAVMPSSAAVKRTPRNRRTALHPKQPASLADLRIEGNWQRQ